MHRPVINQQSFILLCLLIIWPITIFSAEKQGEIIGGATHQIPDWFKESFLEIREDVDEASEKNKHVLLFFQLNGCPYCDRMLTESFETEPLTSYIQDHFDSIALNARGDREIAYNSELFVTEKQLSEILKVRATPAILFLNEHYKQVVRVNGYRSPHRFQHILEYVATKSYQSVSLNDYLSATMKRDVYQLRDHPLFKDITDLSSIKGPLMVVFEDGSCHDCNEFHDGTLTDSRVLQAIKPYTIVRLDVNSSDAITDVDGSVLTSKKMASKYKMIYRPGILVFNEGVLIRRHDSLTFPHHFKESLRFVAKKFYENMTYREYSEARTKELLSQGVTIDLSRAKIN